jgi:chromosome segregation ATPase
MPSASGPPPLALFPTSVAASSDLSSQLARHDSDIDKLSDHRELVHEALLDHRDKFNQLHESVGLVDEGLLDHRKHIKQLRSQSSSALNAHDQALSRLQQDVKSLSRLQHDVKSLSGTTKSMDKGLKTHTTCLELQNKGLQSLSTSHDTLASAQNKVSQEVSNLSKSLKTQSSDAQDRDCKQQIQQLQQKMLETQAQLARLTSQSDAKSVDVTLRAPRKR